MGTPYAVRRGLTFFLRLRVPPDLAPALGEHLVRTLKTTDARVARERAAAVVASMGNLWSMLRHTAMARILGKSLDELTADDVKRSNLDRLWADMEPLGPEDRQAVFHRIEAIISGLEGEIRENRYVTERTRDELDAFRHGQRRGMLEVMQTLRASPPAPTPPPSQPPPPETDPRAKRTIVELADDFFASREFAEKTKVSHRSAFAEFQRVNGNKPIGRITSADVAEYKKRLINQPGRRGRESAAVATVEKNLNHVRGILKWAANEEGGLITLNPGEKVLPPKEGRNEKSQPKRIAFSKEALVRIFSSPLFTGAVGPHRLLMPGPYIAPEPKRFFMLCMLLTGARTEELPGCTVTDIDGVTYLDLRKTGTKTVAGARIVPILPDLRKVGFVEWARQQEKRGVPLFRCDLSAKRWSNFTTYYLNQLGVTDRLLVPYSLRHNFRTMLREADINLEVANRIFGHEEGTTGEDYDPNFVLTTAMARAFVKKTKPPIDLSHLHVTR